MRAMVVPPLLLLAAATAHGQETWAVLAAPVARPAGFPKPSAVCFSSRWKHPSNDNDPHDTFEAAAAFHATGFYWCNGPNVDYFRDIVRRGYTVQGWLSTILPDTVFGNTRQQGRILDQQGELVTGPWMRAFKGWWGCMNSPEYRQVYLDYIQTYLDAGCESLQMDDPGQNMTAVAWGGCWCPYCREKAARLGKQPPEIQAASTYEFYRDMRRAMNDHAGRHVPFSCNAHPGEARFFDDIFDYGMQELNEDQARPGRLHAAVKQAESHGKAILFTYVSRDLRRTRATIALAYAMGTHIIVPWDVYLGTGVPRQFGTAEEYADLYAFARGAAEYLDGYTEAAMIRPHEGPVSSEPSPVNVSGASADLALFVRAKPGDRDAPIVLHAVESGEESKPFQLRLNPARLFGQRPVTIELLSPRPYDEAVHAKAEVSKDFAPLVHRRRLATGFVHTVDLPALQPWGLIVVSPAEGEGLWPPYLAPEPASLAGDVLRVTMQASPGAAVHYTLDGSTPTAASAVYTAPVDLRSDATVKAVTVADGRLSAVAEARFTHSGEATAALAPDAVAGLQLWLRADDLLASHRAGAEVASWAGRAGPDLVWEPLTLYDGRASTPPVVAPGRIGGRAALQFARPTDLMQVGGFANQRLTKGFTVLMVCRSQDTEFGLTGNSLNGVGGVPRLYLMRRGMTFNATTLGLGADDTTGALLTFTHDGQQTVSVGQDGRTIASQAAPEFAAVEAYGSGGNLAVPFWIGNQPRSGELAELVIYDRALTPDERAAVERSLLTYYRLGGSVVWE